MDYDTEERSGHQLGGLFSLLDMSSNLIFSSEGK